MIKEVRLIIKEIWKYRFPSPYIMVSLDTHGLKGVREKVPYDIWECRKKIQPDI